MAVQVTADNGKTYTLPWWSIAVHPEANGQGAGWHGAVAPHGVHGPGMDFSLPVLYNGQFVDEAPKNEEEDVTADSIPEVGDDAEGSEGDGAPEVAAAETPSVAAAAGDAAADATAQDDEVDGTDGQDVGVEDDGDDQGSDEVADDEEAGAEEAAGQQEAGPEETNEESPAERSRPQQLRQLRAGNRLSSGAARVERLAEVAYSPLEQGPTEVLGAEQPIDLPRGLGDRMERAEELVPAYCG